MANDVIYNKVTIIERCLARINEEYQGDFANLKDYTKQDSIILNIQRACEAGIDLAMHTVVARGLGLPQNSRDAFDLLASHSIIEERLAKQLKAMVGFRNIAVHNYQELDLKIVEKIIINHLQDLREFGKIMLAQEK